MDFKNLTKESLPKEFQERIERFNRLFIEAGDGTFEENDLFGYEMGCIKQALSFTEFFKEMSLEEGEYWSSRGVGYDLSGFVKTKAAGERILAMVHEVLGTDKCETYLDYRPSEPTWIQFKFQSSESDLEKLDKLSREADRVVTKEILKQCLHGKSN